MSHRTAFRGLLAFVFAMALSTVANAQLFRAYLDSTGLDTNPCTLPAPCRLLPAALTAVASGGEIWMLDSANYNTATVTIAKSVSILAVPGAVGSVVAIAGPAISITAPGLTIALRNLVIVPLAGGGGTNGILMTGNSTLIIEDSLIANHASDGVNIQGVGAQLEIANTTIRNNGLRAVHVTNGATGQISNSKMLHNGAGGVIVESNTATSTQAYISDSIVSGRGGAGAAALATIAGGTAQVSVTRCSILRVLVGLSIQAVVGTSTIFVSGNMISNTIAPWNVAGVGASIFSLGNNHFSDNGAASGVLTPLALQ